jgi:Cu+-exporting ATPase
LLSENGLTEFYTLGEAAGVRIRSGAPEGQFDFLDEPSVRERLVDFADERISRVTFRLPAIHCIACVWLLENLFRLNAGIGRSEVNFPLKQVSITFENAKTKLSDVAALLASLGYEPELKFSDLESRPGNTASRRLWIQLGIAGFAFGNTMLFSISSYFGLDSFNGPDFKRLFGYLSMALALPVFFYSAADYWRSARASLRRRMLTIEVPIAAGIAALFGQSVYEVVCGRGEGYFDSLAGLLFFLLCGRLFQQKTYDRLAFDRDYKSFFPLSVTRRNRNLQTPIPRQSRASPAAGSGSTAIELRSADFGPLPRGAGISTGSGMNSALQVGGNSVDSMAIGASPEFDASSEERVSLSQLQVGDRLVIRSGELIPADGRLLQGPAVIDYSFVTGESEPMEKTTGDHLYAGGRQMGGAIEVEMVKPVSQSYLTSLWDQKVFRKERAASLHTLTNRYSERFTKAVIAVAVGAAVFWSVRDPARSLKAFTSVLIVACPCALALAAPFGLGTAQRVLARRQVFLKNPDVLETLARVNAVVFDKTGTLTAAGAGSVAFQGVPLTAREERWIYSMTRHSTHPHAVRIGDTLARNRKPDAVRSFVETAGCGMEGSVAGNEIWMGSAAWLESRNVAPAGAGSGRGNGDEPDGGKSRDSKDKFPTSGSRVHVAINGNYRGCYLLAGALRPHTAQLIGNLAADYDLALLSGDNERERERFEALFGKSDQLRFNQSPVGKLDFIQQLQQSDKVVMMVGDGLNDAGAFQQSHVGVAVVENIGSFSPASDVIIAGGMVSRLDDVLRFAKNSVRIVRLSFLISSIYNVVGISIAARGLLSPLVCAILMPLSSVSVVAFACAVTNWMGRNGPGFRRAEMNAGRAERESTRGFEPSTNLSATNPPLPPPGRGTGDAVLLPSWEGSGVGSWSQCAPTDNAGPAPKEEVVAWS